MNKTRTLERHELSLGYPKIGVDDFSTLLLSMKQYGYDKAQPVMVFEGKIIDGWNRYKASLQVGVEPTIKEMSFESWDKASEYVFRMNGSRRNVNKIQRLSALVRLNQQRRVLWTDTEMRAMAGYTKSAGTGFPAKVKKLLVERPDLHEEVTEGRTGMETAFREAGIDELDFPLTFEVTTKKGKVIQREMNRSKQTRKQCVSEVFDVWLYLRGLTRVQDRMVELGNGKSILPVLKEIVAASKT